MRHEARLAAGLILLAGVAGAESGTDRLFETGLLAELPAGTTLSYRQVRDVPENAMIEAIDGELRIAVQDDRTETSFDQPERRITLPPSPVAAGHPALLVFLETATKSMAALSGGSPHYIRNRMIESFQQGPDISPVSAAFEAGDVPAERLVYRPFEGDPNAARMGALSELSLTFTLSGEVPGRLLGASAEAGEYRESLALTEVSP